MSVLDGAQVVSRSNSDLSLVGLVLEQENLSTPAKMAAIAAIGRNWEQATAGSVGRHRAEHEVRLEREKEGRKWIP